MRPHCTDGVDRALAGARGRVPLDHSPAGPARLRDAVCVELAPAVFADELAAGVGVADHGAGEARAGTGRAAGVNVVAPGLVPRSPAPHPGAQCDVGDRHVRERRVQFAAVQLLHVHALALVLAPAALPALATVGGGLGLAR
eukprot:1419183-Prymnesium_polylepis.1